MLLLIVGVDIVAGNAINVNKLVGDPTGHQTTHDTGEGDPQ
jgi:hypothetical protein